MSPKTFKNSPIWSHCLRAKCTLELRRFNPLVPWYLLSSSFSMYISLFAPSLCFPHHVTFALPCLHLSCFDSVQGIEIGGKAAAQIDLYEADVDCFEFCKRAFGFRQRARTRPHSFFHFVSQACSGRSTFTIRKNLSVFVQKTKRINLY